MKKDLWKVSPEEARSRMMIGFEFAICIADVAKSMNIELTKELITIAEDVLEKEITSGTVSFSGNMQMLALAVFGSYEESLKLDNKKEEGAMV